MTRPFAEVYLDEDVAILIAHLLRARGFRALTTRDADCLGKSDAEQLQFAATRGMAILTHNRVDFEVLHQRCLAEGEHHGGIPIAAHRRPYVIVDRLLRLLHLWKADDLQDQLLYILTSSGIPQHLED